MVRLRCTLSAASIVVYERFEKHFIPGCRETPDSPFCWGVRSLVASDVARKLDGSEVVGKFPGN